jgi:CPA1 family monovalent cation:H+ antiporter
MTATLSPFDAAAILIVLATLLGYANHRWLGLPSSVGLTVMGAVASLAMVLLDRLLPGVRLSDQVSAFLAGIDLHSTLLDGMLSFLLFAGALHVDWTEMKRCRWPMLVLSTLGVLLSTGIVAVAFSAAAGLAGLAVPFAWCLVFGALISPTDPVAVMGVLKRIRVSPSLEALVAGESLFNDGVGVVVFTILAAAAASGEPLSVSHGVQLFAVQAGGGVVLGLALGALGFRMMRSIDEVNIEVLITLAVVMGGYSLAHALHVSGPVAMAVAGLLIGNHGVAYAMSETTRDYLLNFWSLIDEILNTVLFLLIGLQVVAVAFDPAAIALSLMAIPIALAARWLSVMGPMRLMGRWLDFGPIGSTTLVWGGLRGGISVALALGLASGRAGHPALLTATYAVVLFAVIVQGGTIERVLRRVRGRADQGIEARSG